MITLWSSEQEAKVLESVDATTFLTQPSCPMYVRLQYPVDTSHSLTVLSLEHESK